MKAFAIQTFCWLPPLNSVTFCFSPILFISNFSIYFLALSVTALSSITFISPKYFFKNKPFISIAGKAIFLSILSSSNKPTPFLSSETKNIPFSSGYVGLFKTKSSPLYFTFPFDLKSPITPLATAILPCPAIPPRPRISPFLISKSSPFSISPGISTHKSFISIRVSALELSIFFPSDDEPTFLPIIHSVISFTLVDFVGTVFIS